MDNELASILYYDGSYQESADDLKHRLLCTSQELELVKKELGEEIRKNSEDRCSLMQLIQERDQTIANLQKILNNLIPRTKQTEFLSENPLLIPGKPSANSGITDSSSLSETYNYGSSPKDSFFDNVSSPDSSSIAFIHNNTMIPVEYSSLDYASMEIERLLSGRILPTRGNFMKAIHEAGPLLQNLLVAGSLPQWRNPPRIQTFQIPPVSIKGCDGNGNGNDVREIKPLPVMSSRPFSEMSCASMMSFNNATPVTSYIGSDTRFINSGLNGNSYVPLGKRERLC